MRLVVLFIAAAFLLTACHTTSGLNSTSTGGYGTNDTLITHSLFNDRASTISEENIQKILDGRYELPQQLRVAIVRLDPSPQAKRYQWNYWNDEQFLKTQQAYLDLFTEKFKNSAKVIQVSSIPELMISKTPSFTNIREAAVRMQADIVVVYSINSDIYSKYKLFSKSDIKAFATTQLIILDVRTGLIPFSAITTRDYLSQKIKEELDHAEAANSVQNEAVLMTIEEIGNKITSFIATK